MSKHLWLTWFGSATGVALSAPSVKGSTAWKSKCSGYYAAMFALALTSVATSVWVALMVLGAHGIRLASGLDPVRRMLLHALPVDERPIRSLGVALSLVFIVFAILLNLANIFGS